MLHAVAMAGQLGSIPCSVEKFVDAMVLMSDNHRTKDEELGFGGMLHMKSVKMRKSLLKCLLDNYDPTEDRVKFGTGESFTITPYDVEVIMPYE